MGVYLRGNVWYMDFRIDGKRYTESIGKDGPVNRTVAKEKYTIRAREVIQGMYKPKTTQTPFDKFKEQYLEWSRANKKPKSSLRDECSLKQLSKFFDGKNLSEINPMMIERYKLNRKEEAAPATINRELACLRNMLNMAATWKKSSKRSWDFGKYKEVKLFKEPPERMRPLLPEEEDRLFAAIQSTPKARHLEPIVLMALHTGMRKGEILNLKWENVNLDKNYITVEKTKNNKNRNIPINNLLKPILECGKLVTRSEYVFVNRQGQPYTDVKTAWWAALKRAGIEDFHFHDLRHTFGTRLGEAGTDIKTIAELMGHSDINMSGKYMHPSPEHKKQAVEMLANEKKVPSVFTSVAKTPEMTNVVNIGNY